MRASPLLVLLLLGSPSTPLSAQTSVRTPPAAAAASPRPHMGAALFAGLNLTVAQQARSKALAAKSHAEWMAVIRRQENGTPISAADQATLKAIAAKHNAAYRAILSDAQRHAFDANLARLRPADPKSESKGTTGGQP